MSNLTLREEAPARLRRMAGRAALVCFLVLIGLPAHSAETDLDRARLAKERAEQAIVARRWCEAAHELERVYRHSGKAEALYNVGLAAERAGDRLFAARAFERFAELSPLSPQRPEALAHAGRIRAAIGRKGPGRSCPPLPPEPADEPVEASLPASPPLDDEGQSTAARATDEAEALPAAQREAVAEHRPDDAQGTQPTAEAAPPAAGTSAPSAAGARAPAATASPSAGTAPTTAATASPSAATAPKTAATASPSAGTAPTTAATASQPAAGAPPDPHTKLPAAAAGSSRRAAPSAALDPRPIPSEPTSPPGHGLRTAGWALIGTGLAGLGAGGGFTWSAGRTAATLEAEAGADPLRPFDTELQGLERDFRFQRDVGAAGLLSGGALVITGAILVLVDGASQ